MPGEYGPESKERNFSAELSELARSLGFSESAQLRELKAEAVADPENAEVFGRWMDAAQAVVGQFPDTDPVAYRKAQLGLLLSHAALLFESGRHENFQEALYDATEYAENLELQEVAERLRGMME